mmetsp:Transcript_104248/g.185245  ORF Transcript_104248/g.185245 Transcript_104248/m.185245 type:complete len:201 (+) Transcript_104248:543-1145(+)
MHEVFEFDPAEITALLRLLPRPNTPGCDGMALAVNTRRYLLPGCWHASKQHRPDSLFLGWAKAHEDIPAQDHYTVPNWPHFRCPALHQDIIEDMARRPEECSLEVISWQALEGQQCAVPKVAWNVHNHGRSAMFESVSNASENEACNCGKKQNCHWQVGKQEDSLHFAHLDDGFLRSLRVAPQLIHIVEQLLQGSHLKQH